MPPAPNTSATASANSAPTNGEPMSCRLCAFLLLASMLTGCARTGGPQFDIDIESLKPVERSAVELAMKLTRDQGLKWGKPIGIAPLGPGWEPVLGERGDCYQVRFRTPEKEIPTLGDRAVLVNAKTGKAILAPRD